MKISELRSILGYELIQDSFEDREIAGGYTSDLLSDVMANATDGSVLITIQAHKNTVAVGSMTNVAALVICNSRPLPEEMIEAAQREEIAVFTTEKNQFQVSGEIYTQLNHAD